MGVLGYSCLTNPPGSIRTHSMANILRTIIRRWQELPGNLRGGLIILLGSFLSVVMSSLIKHVGQRIPVVEILFIRQACVLLIISPIVLTNIRTVFKTNVARLHILRASFAVIAMVTGFTAVVNLPLAEVTALSFIRTLFATLLAIVFLKEVVGIRRWASTIIGFIGVLIIVRPDTGNFNVYALLAMTSAFFVAGINIVMRKLSQIDHPSTIMAYLSIAITTIMAGPAVYFWVTPGWEELLFIAAIGSLMSAMQWLFIQAFKVGEVAAISPVEYSRLIFASIIGIAFFAEVPTVWTLTGAGIIIASTLYTMHRDAVRKQVRRPVQPNH